jgi:type I restriction enzyme S subunit
MTKASPLDWRLVSVADISDVQGGIQKQPKREPVRNKYPFLRVANVGRGVLDLREIHEVELFDQELERLMLQAGDLLVVEGNGSPDQIGRSAMWHGEIPHCVHQNHLIRIRPDDTISPRFLELLWNSPEIMNQLRQVSNSTSGLYTLSTSKIKAIQLAIPPLGEQQRIAQVLDSVDVLRAKRRETIALLDDLAQSIFLDMFGDPASNPRGWPMKRIGDLIDSTNYGTSEKSSTVGDLPVLRMNNITAAGEITLRDLKYMDRSTADEKYIVRSGDVLFNRTNSPELVGKTAIYRGQIPLAFAGYLVRVRMNSNNNPEYLAAFLNTKYSKRVLRNMCKSIVGMANINAREMQSISIAEPPLALQQEFSKRIGAVESLKQVHRAHLVELGSLFASLQHRAFRGELWDTPAPSA